MRLTRFFALQTVLLVLCVSAYGHGRRVDGAARLNSIFADKELLILYRQVSGDNPHLLIGLNPVNGIVRWHQEISTSVYKAHSDNKKEFYTIETSKLVARSRKTGGKLWSIDLTNLRWPEDFPSGLKIKFDFEMPILIDKQFVIFRTSYTRKSRYNVRTYSNDWVALSRTDQRPYSFGQGKFIASDGNIILSGHELFDELMLVEISPDNFRELFIPMEQENNKWGIGASGRQFIPPKNSKFCTFEVRVLGKDDRFLYNTEKQKVIAIDSLPHTGFQVNWANNNRFVLRFSDFNPGLLLLSVQDEHYKKRSEFWIESYDMNGQLIGRLTLPIKQKLDKRFWRWLHFRGVTNDNLFLFVDTHSFNYYEANRKLHVNLLLVDGSFPRVVRQFTLPTKELSVPDLYLLSSRGIIFHVSEDIYLYHMEKPSQDHLFTVRAISLQSGDEIWRHVEKVTIRKRK
jgi:hypothetical protein